jgi:hypothetical protein
VSAASARVTQAELVFADSMGEFEASNGHGCCRDGFEAVHGKTSPLDGSVILFDDVVQILAGSNLNVAPKEGLMAKQPERPSARDVPIERYLPGAAAVMVATTLRKKAWAAAIPRSGRSRKSIVRPCLSTARYR